LSVSYGDEKVKGRVNHEWSASTFNGNMLLETPILEDVNIEYAINGHMVDCSPHYEIIIVVRV
jgi:hypothetical protein